MTQDKLYKVANAVNQMDKHLRTELLIHNGAVQQKKLWENTFIKHQIDKRNCGSDFALCDHIRAMVYAMLSSGIRWNRVESEIDAETGSISSIDSVFHQYDAEYILQANPNLLRDEVKRLHCASQYTLNQMKALVSVNIGKLQEWEQRYGCIDAYYQQFIGENGTLYALVKQLADPMSKDKLAQMGEALIAEYLKNVGYRIAKPDRHIRRILGHSALDCSAREIVPIYDAMAIIDEISKETGKSAAEVDYILWMYCADGFGEICTKMKPKCGLCKANNVCNKGGVY